MQRRIPTLLAATALAVGALQAGTTPANAKTSVGETSLATVLTSDGNTFDRNAKDFDILTEAVLAVVNGKPESPVGLLADGTQRLTAFAPTDQAFRLLAKDLTGEFIWSEEKIFAALVELAGVDTIETILLYHVVPGTTLNSQQVLASNGVKLDTAAGETVTVAIRQFPNSTRVALWDKDIDDRNPRAVLSALNINEGNKQIAHAIDRVLRPFDL